MSKLLNKIKSELQNLKLMITSLFSKSKDKVENDVPYVSQFAHAEFAEKILKDSVEKTTDPNWRDTGAESPEEYSEWVLTMCGMACTSMVLRYFQKSSEGIVSLAKDALENDVYKRESGEISDMRYKEFASWIKKYGVNAIVYTRLGLRGLHKLLSDGNLVIVSVNPNIREYETAKVHQKGGHLVLVTGYNKKTNAVIIHNPSGFLSLNTQENHIIPVQKFLKYYAGRGISLNKL